MCYSYKSQSPTCVNTIEVHHFASKSECGRYKLLKAVVQPAIHLYSTIYQVFIMYIDGRICGVMCCALHSPLPKQTTLDACQLSWLHSHMMKLLHIDKLSAIDSIYIHYKQVNEFLVNNAVYNF